MNRTFLWCQTPESERVRTAAVQLTAAAWDWWEGLPEGSQPVSWAAMLTALRARFLAITSAETARDQLRGFVQGKQSTTEYVDGFRRLIGRIKDMGEPDQLSQFIHGLRASTATQLRIAAVKTVSEAIEMAVRIGSIAEATASSSSSSAASVAAMEVSDGKQGSRTDELLQELLNAMQKGPYRDHGRRGQKGAAAASSSGSSGDTAGSTERTRSLLPVIKSLTEAQVKEYMAADKCFTCGVVGHRCRAPRWKNNRKEGN